MGPWEIRGARYVLGYGEHVIGAIDVAGLESALDAIERLKAGRPTNFDDLIVESLDDEASTWFQSWGSAMVNGDRHQRDLVIRDNKNDRWFYVYGTFLRRFGSGGAYTVVVNRIELGDAPDWVPWFERHPP